jgi:hypothetical protein
MADEKPICRWCGEPIRKDKSGWRHVESDNGRCEALRHRHYGDRNRPLEPA